MEVRTSKRPVGLRLLGWLIGALSVVNLIEDLSFVKLTGRLSSWLDAYANLVDSLSQFAFGWLEHLAFDWLPGVSFGVTSNESHFVVLAALLSIAEIKAIHKNPFRYPRVSSASRVFGLLFMFAGAVFLMAWPAILAQEPYSIWMQSFYLSFWILASFLLDRSPYVTDGPTRRDKWHELVGVLAIAMMIIAVNYIW